MKNVLEMLLIVVFCFCALSKSMSLEPKYSKFEFLEQVLEKVVRVELYTENIEKIMTNSLKVINEISNSTNNELTKITEKMEQFKMNMERYQSNMTAWKVKTEGDIVETMEGVKEKAIADIEAVNREIKSNLTSLTSLNKESLDAMTVWRGAQAVAFNVYTTNDLTLTDSQPVVFHYVRLNTCGDCYSTTNGYFTAPVGGIYQFNAQLCVNKGGNLKYRIVVGNSNAIQGEYRAATDSSDEKCTSFSVVYNVDKGQNVSVRGYGIILDGASHDELSFSGVLVKPS